MTSLHLVLSVYELVDIPSQSVNRLNVCPALGDFESFCLIIDHLVRSRKRLLADSILN